MDITVDKRGRCSIAHRALRQIPFPSFSKIAPQVIELDASHNNISDLGLQIDMFTNLESLILDHNRLQSQIKLSKLPKLKLLYCNSNQIKNISVFIEKVAEGCPNLKILSLMNNDACPNFFNGGSLEQYEDYRLFVISRLPLLQTLDMSNVDAEERKKAKEIYGNLAIKPMIKIQEEAEQKKKLALQQKQKEEEEAKKKKELEEQEHLAKLLKEQQDLAKKQAKQPAKPISVPKNLPDVNAPPSPVVASSPSTPVLSRSNSSASVKSVPAPSVVNPTPVIPRNLPQQEEDEDDEDDNVKLPAPIAPPQTSAGNNNSNNNNFNAYAPTPMLIAARIANKEQQAKALQQKQQAPILPPPRRTAVRQADSDEEEEEDDEDA